MAVDLKKFAEILKYQLALKISPPRGQDMNSDPVRLAVITAAKQILATERSLPLNQLVEKIVALEGSKTNGLKMNTIVVTNILNRYIEQGDLHQEGDKIYVQRGPVEFLLERGFKKTHINEGTDGDVLHHFTCSEFPNIHLQIFEYGDGGWSRVVVAFRTQGENLRVQEIVNELDKLPGKVPNTVWP